MPKTVFVVDDNDADLSLAIDELIRERTLQLQQKINQLMTLQNELVFVLADMVENRDKSTGGHIERTTSYIKILIEAMHASGVLDEEIRDTDKEQLISSSRLHDIGKITISDAILNKPGKLTNEEFETMKTHAAAGVRIIDQVVSRTEDVEFLRNARQFAGYHHERWDGKGYPYGLKGTEIPQLGRIMAIVDVYDALVSVRPYKSAFSPDEAVKIIMDCAEMHFDRVIANLFYEVRDQIKDVAV